MIEIMRKGAPRRSERWDIQVDPEVKESFIEFSHGKGIVIRADSIDTTH